MPRGKKLDGKAIGIIAILLNVLFWGIAPAVIKQGLLIVTPQVFLYYRFLIVLAIATPIILLFPKLSKTLKTPKDLTQLLSIGFLTNPLNLGLLFLGLRYTTSSAAAIIAGIAPLFIVIGSAIFLKERITKNEILGIIIAGLGMAIVIAQTPEQATAHNPLLGNMLVFLYNIVWTVGVLLMKRHAHKHHPFLFGYTGWFMGFACFGIITAITEPRFFLLPLMLTQLPTALFSIVYMAIFGSLVAFTAYQVAQKYLPASEVSIFTYLQTAVAVPISVIWLQEKFTTLFIFGVALTVIGVLSAEIHPSSRIKHILRNGGRR